MVKLFLKYILYPLWFVMITFRFLNIMEPPTNDGWIPGRDYPAILSWSKIARIVGLTMVVVLFLSGTPIDIEAIVSLLVWVGGEGSYRLNQYRRGVDNPDQGEQDV